MNKTYRIKYNQHTGAYVAVAEISTARGKSGGSGRLVMAALLASGLSMAVFSPEAAASVVWGDQGVSAPGVTEGVALGPYDCKNPASSQTVTDANGNSFVKTYPSGSNHEGAWLEGNRGVVLGGGCDNIAVAMQDAVAIGNGAAASVNAVAMGNNSYAQAASSTAIGDGAISRLKDSVALGSGSVANTAAGQVGYLAGSQTDATWKGTLAAVSVGGVDGAGKAQTRQITNVAAGTTLTDAVNVAQLQAAESHYYSVNDGGVIGGNYSNDGASGSNAVAIGVDTKAVGLSSFAAGNNAFAQVKAGVAIGQGAQALGNPSGGGSGFADMGAVAIGYNAVSYDRGISIGNGAGSSTTHGSIAIGQDGDGSVAGYGIGTGALGSGYDRVAIGTETGIRNIGDRNVSIGGEVGNDVNGDDNVALGGLRTGINVIGDRNIAIGNLAGSGINASDTLSLGTSSKASKANSIALGNQAIASETNAIAIGAGSQALGNRDVIIGANTIGPANGISSGAAVGVGSNIQFVGASVGRIEAVAVGEGVQVSDYGTGLGAKAIAGINSTAVGTYALAKGQGSIAIGSANNATGTKQTFAAGADSIAIGNNSNTSSAATGSMALGVNASTTIANSVALGLGSIANVAATPELGYAGSTPVGVVSVGSAGKERQVQNVAAGQINDKSTDAINGSQLYASNSVINQNSTDITELQKGWTLASNNGAQTEQITAGETVNFNPGNNIAISQSGNAISIATTPNVAFDQVTVGGVVINKTTGINAGNTVISNVAAGSALTDAVNVSQLNKAMANAGGSWDLVVNNDPARSIGKGSVVEFKDGQNIAISQSGNAISIATTPNVAFDQVTVGGVVINNTTGINAGGLKVTNVSDGALNSTSKDAVNGSQLYATNTNVTNLGNVVNQHSNTLSQHSNTLAQHSTTINQNSTDITELQKGWTLASNNGAQTEQITAGETVNFNPGNNIAITQTGNSISIATTPNVAFDQMTVGGVVINKTTGINAGNTVISNVAAGSKGTDAVNVDQLDVVKNIAGSGWNVQTNGDKATQVKPGDTVDIGTATGESNIKVTRAGNVIDFELNKNLDLGSTGSVKMGDLTLDNSGLSIVNGPSITNKGIDAGSKTISNVAAGSKGTDAVNVDQLDAVKATAGKGWMLQSDGDKATQVQPGDVVDIGVATGEKNITVSRNGNTVDFALNKNLDLGTTGSVTIGDVLMNDKGFSINNGPSMTADGINAGNKTISNVAAATALTDAVNLSQLNQAIAGAKYAGLKVENGSDTILSNESLNIVGQDGTTVTYDKNSNTYTVSSKQGGGTGTGSMNDWNVTGKDSSGGSVNVPITDGKNVAFAAGSKNVTVTPSQTADGAQVQVDIAKDLELSSVTTKNANGNSTVLNGDGVIAKNANGSSTVINGSGVTIKGKDGKNGASITQAGVDAGNQTLKNVADGQNDTDAVNVRQLNKMGSTINNLGNRINEVEDDANSGIAAAMAVATLGQAYAPGQKSVSMGGGVWRGETGYAVGVSAVSDGGSWLFKANGAVSSKGYGGGGVSATYLWH